MYKSVCKKICFGFLIGIGVLIVILFFAVQGVVRVGNDFFGYVAQDDLASAYGLFTVSAQEITSFNVFEKVSSTYLKIPFDSSVTWSNKKMQLKQWRLIGILKTEIILTDKSKVTVAFELLREDGRWKITYINIKPTPKL